MSNFIYHFLSDLHNTRDMIRDTTTRMRVILIKPRGAESSLPVAHPGYQVLSDILFRLGLIANALTQCSA